MENKSKITLILIIIQIILLNTTLCWKQQIHSIIGSIAEKKLREKRPDILKKVLNMLSPLQTFLPENKDSLIEAPAIPILMANGFFGFLKNFFTNEIPLIYWKENTNEVNIPNPPFYYNITYAMDQAQMIVKQGLDPQHEKNSPIKGGLIDGLMLRYMMNLTGNLHNPISNISFFSKNLKDKKYINGDNNGNKIEIIDVFNKKINNLNELFSTAFNSFNLQNSSLPYEEKTLKTIDSQSNYLMSKYPEEYFPNVENINYLDWQNEMVTLAEEFVYSQVELFPVLNPEYIIQGRRICQEQITLSGYRLYKLLIEIFSKNIADQKQSQIE